MTDASTTPSLNFYKHLMVIQLQIDCKACPSSAKNKRSRFATFYFCLLRPSILQPMHPRCLTQIPFQRTVERHLRVLERGVVYQPVHLRAHGQGGVETVLYAGRVEAERLAVGIAQLYTGGVDIELAGCQLPHTHSPNLA